MVGKLLLFEDNLSIGRFIAVNLRKRGYFLIETTTIHELPELAKQYLPQLMLFEFSAHTTEDWDILEELAGTPCINQIPVILVSSVDLPELGLMHTIPPNVVGVLQKPVGVEDLVGKVKQVIELRTSIDQLNGMLGML